jgi:adenylate cyclase
MNLNELLSRAGQEARASVPYVAVSLAGAGVHFGLLVFFASQRIWPMAAFNVVSVVWFLGVYGLAKRRQLRVGLLLAALELVAHQGLASTLCGLEANFQINVLTLVPLCLIFPGLSERRRVAAAVLPLGVYATLEIVAPMRGSYALDPSVVRACATINLLATLGVSVLTIVHYRRAVDAVELALADQYERTEQLLRGVLPPAVIERLRGKPGVLADRIDGATVLFADLVGFTPLAQKLTPEEVVALLDEIFAAFDTLSTRHGVEKIKTIGDAYMVAGGVPDARADHAEQVARFALDARIAFDELAARHGGTLAVRMGIHTGPLVAGVIGRTKFAYDLWGDVVNTAARMESHGEAGRIHVTSEVAEALRGSFVVAERGEIEVKGKGRMQTFWLEASAGGAAVRHGADSHSPLRERSGA